MTRALVLGLMIVAAPAPAPAHEALESLVPLMQVYNPANNPPEFDVAGIRCAGLFIAQNDWADHHGGAGRPTRAQLQDVEDNLTRAEQQRRNEGRDIVAAQESIRTDVLRVYGLYKARFAEAPADATPPWRDDRLVHDDTVYCNLLNGRRP